MAVIKSVVRQSPERPSRPGTAHHAVASVRGCVHVISTGSMAAHVALFLLLCLVRCHTKTVLQDKLGQ
ncbi:unnamed protein product [Euphydryas editha]|uniref:Uncharacterized protein n=1 Tax=Euphydryas editha TaxID=104508 RepID=A0AAU9V2Y0_EUPED|nr:unnamed protein product [Euphydryas editha]